MKKKLLLINPVNTKKAQFQNDRFASLQPLGLGIIAALTPQSWDVELLDENFEPFSFKEADLVGITAYTPSANRAYQIARSYKAAGIPVVMGGIHASMLPDEALRFVDTVVIGEAESIWEKVISDFESGKLESVYQGEQLPLTGAPQPLRNLFNPKYLLTSVQTTRGCPMHCNFCSVSVFNGRKYRKRPVDEVLDELQNLQSGSLFFVDDNLIGHGAEDEKRAISLFKGMIDRKLNKRWACQTSLNVANNEEVLYYASKSGCQMMLIGIESEKESSLRSFGKNINLSILNQYKESFRMINKHKIAVLGCFIFGSDSDSLDDLHARTQFIKKSRIDVMQATILTPYPGTKLYKEFESDDRLLYTDYPEDWERYDMTDVVFKPAQMTHKELTKYMIACFSSLTNAWNFFLKFMKTIYFTKSFITALWAINMNRIYRGIALKKIKEWKLKNF